MKCNLCGFELAGLLPWAGGALCADQAACLTRASHGCPDQPPARPGCEVAGCARFADFHIGAGYRCKQHTPYVTETKLAPPQLELDRPSGEEWQDRRTPTHAGLSYDEARERRLASSWRRRALEAEAKIQELRNTLIVIRELVAHDLSGLTGDEDAASGS